jgi:hypothetical protein
VFGAILRPSLDVDGHVAGGVAPLGTEVEEIWKSAQERWHSGAALAKAH